MKIKQVCEATGLTDRAIRYYIEEELLSPAYTENYMGRRAYDFTEADVAALNHVATLRKFGFTVEEIRRILTDPQESVAVVAEVRARKEETLRQESENLDALSRLDAERAYTVAELAEKLAEPVREVEVPKEDRWLSWKDRLISWLKATPIWVVMLEPVVFMLMGFIDMALDMRYLTLCSFTLSVGWVVCTLLAFLPTIMLGVMQIVRRFRPVSGMMQGAAVAGCIVFLLPVGLLAQCFSMWYVSDCFCSHTEDIAHYMQVDDIFRMYPEVSRKLFPANAHTASYEWKDGAYLERPVEAEYSYLCTYDGNNHLYAQWTLSAEELAEEVARVEGLMFGEANVFRLRHGSYECLARTTAYGAGGGGQRIVRPFALTHDKEVHDLTMFAWNAETNTVRYIYCDGYSSAEEPPHYMTLDWGEGAAS